MTYRVAGKQVYLLPISVLADYVITARIREKTLAVASVRAIVLGS